MFVNGSLESTGRRMMLFGRLIDEYSGTALNKTRNSSILDFTNAKQPVNIKAENQTLIKTQ